MKYDKNFIEKIERQYGLPCYVFDEDAFRENYCDLRNTLKRYYSKYEIAYSYKTNYAPAICKIVKEMGGYAEVVSDMEYAIAKKIGYESSMIVYNGPFKGELLEEHLLNGGIVNIDNMKEIRRIIAFSEKVEKCFNVGIRVNINVGQSFVSRFGIDADSDDLKYAVELINNSKYLKLIGLHCHIGQARNLVAWKSRTEQILQLADKYIEGTPKYLDLGSGMFGKMDEVMASQFTSAIPSYEDYAEVTAKIVYDHYRNLPEEERPILFTEPGTTVDNKYVDLIAQIACLKKIKGKSFGVINASIHNLGDVCTSVSLPIEVVHYSDCSNRDFDAHDFVGYTCLEQDVAYSNYNKGIADSDYLIFGNVGGYSNVDKPPFILPQCAMIGVSNGESYLIKRRETVEDILLTYIV